MSTFQVNACGQNVAVEIDSRLYDPNNQSILGPYDYFDQGADSYLSVTLTYGKRRRAYVDEDFNRITHYRGRAGSHIIRQLVCYLASYHTRSFEIVHGTGLLVKSHLKKGILLVGRGHSGKSTLSRHLGYTIMDDDIMLMTRDTMRVTGKMGFATYRQPATGRKYLTPLPEGEKEAKLSLVLILDKREQGGKFWDIDNTIPRRFTVLDDLPPILMDAYLKLPPIRVDAPIFRLGTRGKLPQTVDALRDIINQHI